MGAQKDKLPLCSLIVGDKIHQLIQIVLFLRQLRADGIHQFKDQRHMPHHIVHRCLFQGPQHRVLLLKSLQNLRCDLGLAQLLGGGVVDGLQRHLHIDPQDIDLVRVPQDLAEHPGPLIQILWQAVGAVAGHRHPHQRKILFLRGLLFKIQVVPYQLFLSEEQILPEECMVDGIRVVEGVIPAKLLETPHIVKHSQQPGKFHVLRRQRQTLRNLPAQLRHLVGVDNLQVYFFILRIIISYIGGKGLLHSRLFDPHYSFLSLSAVFASALWEGAGVSAYRRRLFHRVVYSDLPANAMTSVKIPLTAITAKGTALTDTPSIPA